MRTVLLNVLDEAVKVRDTLIKQHGITTEEFSNRYIYLKKRDKGEPLLGGICILSGNTLKVSTLKDVGGNALEINPEERKFYLKQIIVEGQDEKKFILIEV